MSFKEKNVKRDLPDEDGVQMWTWLFQMCGGSGWGVSGLTCLQDEMEKLLAATGESRTGGRGKR